MNADPEHFIELASATRRAVDPDKWIIPASKVAHEQRRHFLLCVFLPSAATLVGFVVLPREAFTFSGVGVWVVAWLLVGGLGVSVGFHRHFAHRAFAANTFTRYVMGMFGSMAAQGSVIYWAALHRRHHSFSDLPGDPHSPATRGNGRCSKWGAFWYGHVMWAISHDVPKPSRYVKDLLADPVATTLSKYYWSLVGLGLVLPAVAGYFVWGKAEGVVYGAFWGGALRIAVGHQVIWAVNSVCHAFGYRSYETPDYSKNNGWLSIISFGESWHNNHHYSATSARFGHRWFEVDIGWLLIGLLKLMGLVSGVRR